MSTKKFSPAAQLLRNSRLFSMPNAIPPPPNPSIMAPPASPYPTLQAITTPKASAFRGDWGLKRDLPLAVSKKTAYMRYGELDTINHMTTFESAHDDVYTLRKWQELDIAIEPSLSGAYDAYDSSSRSFYDKRTVFDDDVKPEGYKWRYQGPFVQGMAPKEMREYIKKHIEPRKDEFYAYVAKRQRADMLKQDSALLGTEKPTEEELQAARDAPEEKVDLLALRANLPYLEKLVTDFLDIPINKPHRTHPSAGLHYTRSNAYAYNDPERGPQPHRKEVPGRQLNWQIAAGTVAGVGGVVAKVQKAVYGRGPRSDDRFTVHKYRPLKATIDQKGKIMLEVEQVMQVSDMYRQSAQGVAQWQDYAATRFRRDDPSMLQRKAETENLISMVLKGRPMPRR
jgi:hypothetical protein